MTGFDRHSAKTMLRVLGSKAFVWTGDELEWNKARALTPSDVFREEWQSGTRRIEGELRDDVRGNRRSRPINWEDSAQSAIWTRTICAEQDELIVYNASSCGRN